MSYPTRVNPFDRRTTECLGLVARVLGELDETRKWAIDLGIYDREFEERFVRVKEDVAEYKAMISRRLRDARHNGD